MYASATASEPAVSDCWIGIDLGTSSVKVIAIDETSEVVAQTSGDYPLRTPRPGWAEQDPELWWQVTDRCVAELVAQLDGHWVVRGIGLCGQMHGLTALDDHDRVIRPAILWNDQRSEGHCRQILSMVGGLDALLAMTGNHMLPGYTAGKILWLRDVEPEAYTRMRSFLNPKDFLRLRMTGEHATEVSDASGTGLFDVSRRCWSRPLIAALGLDESLFPRATESHEISGHLLPEVARRWGLPPGTPVAGGGGDSVLQTTATGMVTPGLLGVTLGTAGIVAAAADHCPRNENGRLQVSCGNSPDLWHVMGVTLSAGGAFQWLRDALAPIVGEGQLSFERLVQLAEESAPGAKDLMFLPYLLGERCPQVAPHARGAWIGLTPAHSAPELVRSVMEGVVLNLRQIRDLFAEAGLAVDDVRVNGGATRGPAWVQLVADVLGSDVSTVSAGEHGGALGAALLAGVGTGHWSSFEQALGHVATTATVSPRAGATAVYDRLFPHFQAIHEALEPLYSRLSADDPQVTAEIGAVSA
jgi:xylulokinase